MKGDVCENCGVVTEQSGVFGLCGFFGGLLVESAETLADMHPGQSTYTEACISCHNPGIGGAPRLGDADAWQPRAAKGRQALVNSTINGLNGMPAKGMC